MTVTADLSASQALDLPGTPPPALRRSYGALTGSQRAAVRPHLLGGTSADYLADWFRRAGAPVGATTLKTYRRSLKGA